MIKVGPRSVWLLAAAVSMSAGAAMAQLIPGQVPDPSSYAGSMELQRREAESARQNAPQAQPDSTPRSSSSGGGPVGPAPRAPPEIDWTRRAPLAAASNPLLGRWQPNKIDPAQLAKAAGVGQILGVDVGALAANLVIDSFQEDCDAMFGRQPVEFDASGLVSPGGDGRPVVTPLAYRADGADVIVLRREGGLVEVFRFKFAGRNQVSASPPGCPMSRLGGVATASLGAGTPGAGVRAPPPPAAPNSTLAFEVGAAAPGRFNPLPGANIFIVTGDPDAALAKAGFAGSPVESWLKTCKTNNQACIAGFQAITAGALANVQTDAAGHAQLPSLPQGRYFLFGMVAYEGHSLVWHKPVTVQPGPNTVFLDQTTATAG